MVPMREIMRGTDEANLARIHNEVRQPHASIFPRVLSIII